jgi:hypothetical protein
MDGRSRDLFQSGIRLEGLRTITEKTKRKYTRRRVEPDNKCHHWCNPLSGIALNHIHAAEVSTHTHRIQHAVRCTVFCSLSANSLTCSAFLFNWISESEMCVMAIPFSFDGNCIASHTNAHYQGQTDNTVSKCAVRIVLLRVTWNPWAVLSSSLS